MRKSERRRIDLALLPIRAAIRGWAFGDDHFVSLSLTQAEGLAAGLPADIRGEADALLAPLRDRLARHGAAGA